MHGFCICAFPHTTVGRIVGQAGYDYVFLDWEHTPMSEFLLVLACYRPGCPTDTDVRH